MLLKIMILTVLIEAITLTGRYGFKKQATRDTAFMAKYTFGYRIHHGYLGLVLIIGAFLQGARLPGGGAAWLYIIGFAMLFSDLIHHFIFLRLIEGDPEFHIRYKP